MTNENSKLKERLRVLSCIPRQEIHENSSAFIRTRNFITASSDIETFIIHALRKIIRIIIHK
jgi:hypothetical protein